MILRFLTGLGTKVWAVLGAVGMGMLFLLRLDYLKRKNRALKGEVKGLRKKEKISGLHQQEEENLSNVEKEIDKASSADDFSRRFNTGVRKDP